jgi:hypothetical protein
MAIAHPLALVHLLVGPNRETKAFQSTAGSSRVTMLIYSEAHNYCASADADSNPVFDGVECSDEAVRPLLRQFFLLSERKHAITASTSPELTDLLNGPDGAKLFGSGKSTARKQVYCHCIVASTGSHARNPANIGNPVYAGCRNVQERHMRILEKPRHVILNECTDLKQIYLAYPAGKREAEWASKQAMAFRVVSNLASTDVMFRSASPTPVAQPVVASTVPDAASAATDASNADNRARLDRLEIELQEERVARERADRKAAEERVERERKEAEERAQQRREFEERERVREERERKRDDKEAERERKEAEERAQQRREQAKQNRTTIDLVNGNAVAISVLQTGHKKMETRVDGQAAEIAELRTSQKKLAKAIVTGDPDYVPRCLWPGSDDASDVEGDGKSIGCFLRPRCRR